MRFLLSLALVFSTIACAEVAVTGDSLTIDGKAVPYLFGAEVQYFRARGAVGRNVPVATVHQVWEKLIDRMVEANMNTAIFYIPWDFHEPIEGMFDFTGKADLDKDGKPDYPSRDINYFLGRLQARGIRHVMVRPGPYINAEWGPTGFGAVPRWFLDKYPTALAQSTTYDKPTKGRPRTVSLGSPIFRERVTKWFTALNTQVLKNWIGPNKPVKFLQLDNESNYFWDSMYQRDYSDVSIARYHKFLRTRYNDSLDALNRAYGTKLASFETAAPPREATDVQYGKKEAWHYDWFHFHDIELRDYYVFLKQQWLRLGVREPNVVFTSCDSINAPGNGLLPRLDYRQENRLTLTTMNLYPKTYGTKAESTMNTPMKAAHDATFVAASHAQVYGGASKWVMSTETVGGWFPPTEVTLGARQHTYLSMLGTGVKAVIIYYFHEGYNWTGLDGPDVSEAQLMDEYKKYDIGLNKGPELKFDAPLDKDLEPRPAFGLLKEFGRSLKDGLAEMAIKSHPVYAPVLIAHNHNAQYPIPGGPNVIEVASTESAALYGMLREAGSLPNIGFVDRMTIGELSRYRVIFWQDRGYLPGSTRSKLKRFVQAGGTLVTLGDVKLDVKAEEKARVVNFAKSPAEGWNGDNYTRIKDASARLATLRGVLKTAGVLPMIVLTAEDGQPFVHAWLNESTDGKRLLYVENFAGTDRRVKLQLAAPLGKAAGYRLVPRLLAGNAKFGPVVAPAAQLTTDGVTISVSADGVDVWELEAQP